MENATGDCSKGKKCAKFSSTLKKRKYQTVCVRRSHKIQNIIKPSITDDREALFEDLTLSDTNEEENKQNVQEDEQHVHMEKEKLEPNLCDKNMEEKIDYIVQTLECLQNSVETLNIKIESLTKENDELSKELEAALAIVEALNNWIGVF
ncbi:hypothetical protein FNV43_RR00139 [Rhamnella rubrinervis]|uniref:Uncharacterized protein n=1 Tax=Rhamnella rubrinervis TaxID=2594499 RepID=A0A8K0MRM3_9ROSA|nr:hypothetical protein FNV43_RR00139 [Rhamnella rubrinervis]